MSSFFKRHRIGWINSLSLLSMISLLTLQSLWLYNNYQLVYKQFINESNEAFNDAYKKEQLYRMPAGNIINTNELTLQNCGNEEIRIIRHCPDPDTIIYRNDYGHSLETAINRAFYDLREKIVPLNIHCLSDLFAGALFERGIQADFVIEKRNPATSEVLSTSATPDAVIPGGKSTHTLIIGISETEELRALLHFEQSSIFRRMTSIIIASLLLLLVTIVCVGYQLRYMRKQAITKETILAGKLTNRMEQQQRQQAEIAVPDNVFRLGNYTFDADKNELKGFGTTVILNKKEDGILTELCKNFGKVVERNTLLEKYWGSTGFIYSRSLDTYITRLRKYLKDDQHVQIVTIKGQGYKIVTD